MKVILFSFILFWILFCAYFPIVSLEMFKVSYEKSPHGTALKIVNESNHEVLLWDERNDIFAPASTKPIVLCTDRGCCSVHELYAPEKEDRVEHEQLLSMELNHREGVDRWIMYYYLCGDGTRKGLRNEKDMEAFHLFYSSVFEHVNQFEQFFKWFQTISIQE